MATPWSASTTMPVDATTANAGPPDTVSDAGAGLLMGGLLTLFVALFCLLPVGFESGYVRRVAFDIVVFMLLVGLEIDLRLLRARRRLIGAVTAGQTIDSVKEAAQVLNKGKGSGKPDVPGRPRR